MANYAGHSHVTGSGYQSVSRKCVKCTHSEMEHWEDHCAHKYDDARRCRCRGFAARRLTREERRIITQANRDAKVAGKRQAGEAGRVEEGWLKDLRDEWSKRRIEGIDY